MLEHNLVIYGEGGKGGKGHTPTEASDTLIAIQKVSLLIAISEGEIANVDNVYLNQVPIADYEATWEWRSGLPNQDIIAGFLDNRRPNASFSPSALKYLINHINTIKGDVDACLVTLTLAYLRVMQDNGDVVGNTATYVVYTRIGVSGTWSKALTSTKTGKCSSNYSWDLLVYRPTGVGVNDLWQINVVKESKDGDLKHGDNTTYTQLVEIRYQKLNYPNTALVGITLKNPDQFNNVVPEITFKVKGIKVRVPSNYKLPPLGALNTPNGTLTLGNIEVTASNITPNVNITANFRYTEGNVAATTFVIYGAALATLKPYQLTTSDLVLAEFPNNLNSNIKTYTWPNIGLMIGYVYAGVAVKRVFNGVTYMSDIVSSWVIDMTTNTPRTIKNEQAPTIVIKLGNLTIVPNADGVTVDITANFSSLITPGNIQADTFEFYLESNILGNTDTTKMPTRYSTKVGSIAATSTKITWSQIPTGFWFNLGISAKRNSEFDMAETKVFVGWKVPTITSTAATTITSTQTDLDKYNVPYLWDGSFKSLNEWTANPAWILYYVLTDKRSGLGIPDAELDIFSFYNLALYCDEAVNDGAGVIEPRYTLNYQFFNRESSQTFINYILTICNANISNNEFGQISVVYDRPNIAVTKQVTNANVVNGDFTYSSSPLESRSSSVNVTYNDKSYFGRTNTVTHIDETLVARYGLQTVDVVLPGCTSKGQALRKAKWACFSNGYRTKFINFSVLFEGMQFRIGEIIRVYDKHLKGPQLSGRIVSSEFPNQNTTLLLLDRIIDLPNNSICHITNDGNIIDTVAVSLVTQAGTRTQITVNKLLDIPPESIFIMSNELPQPPVISIPTIPSIEAEKLAAADATNKVIAALNAYNAAGVPKLTYNTITTVFKVNPNLIKNFLSWGHELFDYPVGDYTDSVYHSVVADSVLGAQYKTASGYYLYIPRTAITNNSWTVVTTSQIAAGTYTISFDYLGAANGATASGQKRQLVVQLAGSKSNNPHTWVIADILWYIQDAVFVIDNNTPNTHSWTFTLTAAQVTAPYFVLRFFPNDANIRQLPKNYTDIYISNPKFEVGNIATYWCPTAAEGGMSTELANIRGIVLSTDETVATLLTDTIEIELNGSFSTFPIAMDDRVFYRAYTGTEISVQDLLYVKAIIGPSITTNEIYSSFPNLTTGPQTITTKYFIVNTSADIPVGARTILTKTKIAANDAAAAEKAIYKALYDKAAGTADNANTALYRAQQNVTAAEAARKVALAQKEAQDAAYKAIAAKIPFPDYYKIVDIELQDNIYSITGLIEI